MIDKSVIKARIKRSGISNVAGGAFRDIAPAELSPIWGTDFLFVLFDGPERWTAISTTGVDYQYYGPQAHLSISEAAERVHAHYFERGKGATSSFVDVDTSNDKMWIVNTQTAQSLLNILNFLESS